MIFLIVFNKSMDMVGSFRSDIFHVVFTLKNSRYEWQRIKRKRSVGFISFTSPIIDDKEEDVIVEEICKVANELNMKLIALNFCGDHVHCILCCHKKLLSKTLLLWKGKTAYNFNRRTCRSSKYSIVTGGLNKNHGLWAKSYYQKALINETEILNVTNYIVYNRRKHGLQPLSIKSSELISKTIKNNNHL